MNLEEFKQKFQELRNKGGPGRGGWPGRPELLSKNILIQLGILEQLIPKNIHIVIITTLQ